MMVLVLLLAVANAFPPQARAHAQAAISTNTENNPPPSWDKVYPPNGQDADIRQSRASAVDVGPPNGQDADIRLPKPTPIVSPPITPIWPWR